jgi:hypothetical protein
MRRLAAWVGANIDGVVAFAVAVVIVVVDVFSSLPIGTVISAILLVLGVLSVAMLRDRARKEDSEQQVLDYLRRSGEIAQALTSLEATIGTVVRALSDASMVRVLSWPEVAMAHAEARRSTDRWVFRGGTGTYIRAVTLRECVANARRDRRALLVRLEIIDPTNEDVCANYARFRRSLSVTQTDWTLERTQRESYATILACCWYRQRYELLDIKVGLSQVMPTLRWDLSARSLIITQEDPRGPALLVASGKLLYDYLHTELSKSLEQAHQVPVERVRHVQLGDDPTVDETRKLFLALNMALPSTFTDRDVADIIMRALHAENPYDP